MKTATARTVWYCMLTWPLVMGAGLALAALLSNFLTR